jgi:glycosyltransferase involved in cell wall biosynthesis
VPIEHTTLSGEVAQQSQPWLWKLAYRVLYPRADRIVACSHAIADDLVSVFGIAPSLLRMLRNPIDEARIEAALAAGTSPFPGEGPHVLAAGRLAHVKGYDRWLLGDGPERGKLEDQARAAGLEGRVHFVGYTADPYPWMRFSDVFVQSSRREGLPVAVLEAAACGARLVAFDSPGGTREILSAIPGAQLVPDGDVNGLARAISRALSTDAPQRARLPDEFRLARVIADYTALLENP